MINTGLKFTNFPIMTLSTNFNNFYSTLLLGNLSKIIELLTSIVCFFQFTTNLSIPFSLKVVIWWIESVLKSLVTFSHSGNDKVKIDDRDETSNIYGEPECYCRYWKSRSETFPTASSKCWQTSRHGDYSAITTTQID